MIEHNLPNKIKSATVTEPKLFHQLNNPTVHRGVATQVETAVTPVPPIAGVVVVSPPARALDRDYRRH
jgi:hypothetical protein